MKWRFWFGYQVAQWYWKHKMRYWWLRSSIFYCCCGAEREKFHIHGSGGFNQDFSSIFCWRSYVANPSAYKSYKETPHICGVFWFPECLITNEQETYKIKSMAFNMREQQQRGYCEIYRLIQIHGCKLLAFYRIHKI